MTHQHSSDDLVEALADAVVVVATDGTVVRVNAAAERMFGHERSDLVGRDHAVLIPSGLTESLAGMIADGDVAPGPLGTDLTLLGRHRDGTSFPVEVHLAPLPERGAPIVATVRDVTHRQLHDDDLRNALSLVNATLESTADGILVVAADGTIAGANSQFVAMWGIPEELMASRDDDRLLGFVLDQLVDPEVFVSKVHELYEHPAEESNDVLEFRDGRTFERYSRPQRVDDEIVGRVWSFRDVTVRRVAQEQRREALAMLSSADARFRSLVESSDDSIVSSTPQGVITSWNAAAERLFGYRSDEAVGQHIEMLVRPELRGQAEEIQRRAMMAGETRRSLETEFVRRDRSLVPVSLTVSPIYDGEAITGVSAIIRDVTVARARQAELETAQAAAEAASRAKSDFLATMSHEIRTPMNGVIGLTGLLLNTSLDEVQRRYAAGVRGAGEALLAIIDDILDFSKLEAGKVDLEEVAFGPQRLVEEIGVLLASAAADQGLELRTVCAPDVPTAVLGDAGRIRQVLINLAGNAVKFTPAGHVEVRVVRVSGDGEDRLRFEVEDTGIGIDAHTRARLFEPFSQADASTTRRFGGTGLGLAISRRLVHKMGGDLLVDSEPGAGSTFRFELELPATTVTASESPQAGRRPSLEELDTLGPNPVPLRSSPASAGSRRVLVAEDNAVNQMVALGLLTELGYDAVIVSHGRHALDALEGEHFDAVLMDCHMPEMDGFAATRELRRREDGTRRTPVIAMTAGVLDEDRDRCFAAGMDDFVAKPVDVNHLRVTLRRWIGAPVPAANVLDPDRVASLRRLGPDDGLGLLRAVVPAFIASSGEDLALLRGAVADGDTAAVLGHAHRLKGSAGNVGAQHVEAACLAIEQHVRETDTVPDLARVERVADRLAAAVHELEEIVGG
ncbi:PAS domain S-box-containing protein [Nocardioides ginsengisegetis]|uniref:Circadian input-output histidine kinase CikA n=1 Tax=Nocardioides ginsengisegetis TaxID=661491 RepID=A0A7W3IZG2_9ACTN|nr:PAS domain S-box-containing protein [Nocardioides ginsengisegetis]